MVAVSLLLVLSSFPGDARSWLLQAQQYFEQRKWEDSRQAAIKALEIDPQLGDAEVLLGLVATMRSDFQEAGKRFRRAADLQPRNPRVYAYLGATYLQEKRHAEAAQAFERVLQLDPGNTAALYNLGLLALSANRPAEALAHFDRVCAAQPRDAAAWIGALESRLLLKRGPEAVKAAQQLQTLLEPRDPRALQVATLLVMHDEFEAAIPFLERAPREQGARARNLLGLVEERRGRIGESVSAYRQAAELEPANEDFRFDYAGALLQYRDSGAAITAFEQGRRDFPKSWKMRLGLGSALYLAGKYEDAARTLLEAVRLKPDAAPLYFLLGHAYEAAPTEQSEIRAAFQAYLSTSPRDAWAHYHYGYMLYLLSQSERQPTGEAAKASLLRALELNPSFPEALLQLGVMADSEEEGVRYFERAVKLNPNLGLAHYRLGLAYQRAGKVEEAKQQMDLFRKLRAQDTEAQRRSVLESLR